MCSDIQLKMPPVVCAVVKKVGDGGFRASPCWASVSHSATATLKWHSMRRRAGLG